MTKTKLTEENVIRAWEVSPTNPYTSVNDYYFDQNERGDWWVIGDDGRKWWAWWNVYGKRIAFTKY